MAILQNPLIGRAKQKLGNTVFSTQFGKNTLRTKPLTIKNPKTAAQLAVRTKMKKLVVIIRQVQNYINTAYAGSVHGMSAINRVVSLNMKNCWVDNTSTIDPSLFVLCDHDGSFVDNVVLTSTVANTITGVFNSKAQTVEEGNDFIKAYGFHVDGNKIWQFDQVGTRSTGTITLTAADLTALNVAVYFECLDRLSLIHGNPKHVIKYVGTVLENPVKLTT
jgi:hypothetical protein